MAEPTPADAIAAALARHLNDGTHPDPAAILRQAAEAVRDCSPRFADFLARVADHMPPAPFTCPRCHRTSHNPNDARHDYCGACHVYITGDPT